MSIKVAYSPTETADDQTKDIYIKQLCSAKEGSPSHDCLVVLTDDNDRLGPDNVLSSKND